MMRPLPIFTCLLFSFCLFTFNLDGQSNNKSAKEEVAEILETTKNTNSKLATDINALFSLVKKSISDADKITKKLKKKFAEKDSKNLNTNEIEEVTNILKEIHGIYQSIDENRDLLYKLLSNYDSDIDTQVKRAKNLVGKYKSEMKKNEDMRYELLMKSELTEIEKQNLESSETNVKILKGIIEYLENIQIRITHVEAEYEKTNTEISNFFNTIRNGKTTTQYLIDYFELTLEYEKIMQNAENIIKLEELTKGISNSLRQLTESIEELKRSANNI